MSAFVILANPGLSAEINEDKELIENVKEWRVVFLNLSTWRFMKITTGMLASFWMLPTSGSHVSKTSG